jgi:hypothetical protein
MSHYAAPTSPDRPPGSAALGSATLGHSSGIRSGTVTDTTFLSLPDDWRRESRGSIVPDSSQTLHGLPPNLTPRKGQFNSSPWQRHGKTAPKKNPPCKGTLTCAVPSKWWRHHGAPLQGLLFDNGLNPRRCHGLRVACPFGAETLRLSLGIGMIWAAGRLTASLAALAADALAIPHAAPPPSHQ